VSAWPQGAYWRRKKRKHVQGRQKTGLWFPGEEWATGGAGMTHYQHKHLGVNWQEEGEPPPAYASPRDYDWISEEYGLTDARWFEHTHEGHHVRASVRVAAVRGGHLRGAHPAVEVEAVVDTGATLNVITEKLRKRLKALVTPAPRAISVLTGSEVVLQLNKTCTVIVEGRSVTCWVTRQGPERLILGLPFIRRHGVDLNKLFLLGPGSADKKAELEFLNHMASQRRHEDLDKPDDDLQDAAEDKECFLQESVARDVVANRKRLGQAGEHARAGGTDQSWGETTIGPAYADRINEILALPSVQPALAVHPESNLRQFDLDLKPGARTRLAKDRLAATKVGPAQQELIDYWAEQQVESGAASWVTDKGSIKHSSRVVVAPKASGDGTRVRVAIALNQLNDATSDQPQTPVSVDHILQRVKNPTCFSNIDLRAAYNQIGVAEGAKPYLHVSVGNDRFLKLHSMPFGAKLAGTHFVNELKRVLGDIEGYHENVYAYIDDIVIVSSDVETHLRLVREILERLAAHKITINAKKTHLMVDEIDLVGFAVSTKRLAMTKTHIDKVRQQKPPRTLTQLRSFLGLVNGDTRFVKGHAAALAPLRALLKGKSKEKKAFSLEAQWTPQCQSAFEEVKRLITSAPFLHWIAPEVPFEISTDASDYGVGGVVKQLVPERDEHGQQVRGDGGEPQYETRTVYHFSKALTEAQRKWPVYVKEAYAIYLVVKKFRPLIEVARGKTVVLTDHAPLQWILKSKNAMVYGWATTVLLGLDIEYKYLPGPLNVQADSLSRFLYDEVTMHTEHVEAFIELATMIPAQYSLVFAQEDWVDATQAPQRFEVHKPDSYNRLLNTKAGKKTKMFIKILDSATRDAQTIEKMISTGHACCFILPMELYGELFDGAPGNRIAFLERGTCAVLRNVGKLWDDKIVSRGPAQQPVEEAVDVDILLAMDVDDEPQPAELGRDAPAWRAMELPHSILDIGDGDAIRELIIDTHVSTYHAQADRIYPILAPVLPLGSLIPGARVAKSTKTYWIKQIKDTIKGCMMCPQIKAGRASKSTKFGSVLLRPTAPHEAMSMDIHTLGPSQEGYAYILTVIDMGSRRVRLIKMKDRKSETVARALLNGVILEQGTFKTLMSDRAPEFVHAVVKKLCAILKIEQILCAPHSPWSRGVVERVHREVNVGVRTLEDAMNWPHVIKAIEFAINTTKHTATGVSPMEMEFMHPVTHFRVHDLLSAATAKDVNVIEQLAAARTAMGVVRKRAAAHQRAYVEKYLAIANKDRHDVQHSVGDRVLARREETGIALNGRRYCQPAEITMVQGKQAGVRFENDGKEAVVHRQHLIPLSGEALELTEEAMHGFERNVTPSIGGTQEDPLEVGTMVWAQDHEVRDRVLLAQVMEIHGLGGGELEYKVHYWYSTSGKKDSWKPAYIHRQDQTTVSAPRKNARRIDRDPWTGVHGIGEIITAGFDNAHGELRELKRRGFKPLLQKKH
jgi:transposase InsO family protein